MGATRPRHWNCWGLRVRNLDLGTMLPARKVHLLCVVKVPWPVTSRGLTGSIYIFVCDTHTMWTRRAWWAAVIWEIPEDTTREPLFEACCWKHSEEGITLVCKALLNTSTVKSKDKLSLTVDQKLKFVFNHMLGSLMGKNLLSIKLSRKVAPRSPIDTWVFGCTTSWIFPWKFAVYNSLKHSTSKWEPSYSVDD